ncbi:MAG TPA: DNA topoisomerase IB [Actinomycetota bacterium]|nr:DNA topoisomerase IB [Actinomycetota bacterium]
MRRGRGFAFVDAHGSRLDDLETLQRIKDLGIPPAWTDVWICPHPNGHLQAVGIDAAGRKQYLYHPDWRRRRDQEKFDRMLEFARALPKVRHLTNEHLRTDGLTAERVLACSVRLLDRGFFRIGGETYAETNETYGLATMRKQHVKLSDRAITFEYIAKSKKERYFSLVDAEVYDVVAALKRRRGGGDELLAYKVGSSWRDVKSSDINLYLKEISGGDYSAKDFRTWHGTVLASLALAVSTEAFSSKAGRKRAISRAVQEAAHYLGNTPTVCRKSYIDPRVIDRYESGVTISGVLEELGDVDLGEPALQGTVEDAVLDLIEGTKSSAIEKVTATAG